MSNNWIVENIQNALGTWNDKLNEIWRLLTESPESFKGGAVWNVMRNDETDESYRFCTACGIYQSPPQGQQTFRKRGGCTKTEQTASGSALR